MSVLARVVTIAIHHEDGTTTISGWRVTGPEADQARDDFTRRFGPPDEAIAERSLLDDIDADPRLVRTDE